MENIILSEGSFADALRKDLVEQYLKDVSESDILHDISEKPDYDLLLEPYHSEGYEYQTYIQYIDEHTFKYYEGFSSYCWKGFRKQKQHAFRISKCDFLSWSSNYCRRCYLAYTTQ